jgi:hypothetical protein
VSWKPSRYKKAETVAMTEIRLENRRIYMYRVKDGNWLFKFKRLGAKEFDEPRVVIQNLLLSDEAVEGIVGRYLSFPSEKEAELCKD